MRYLPVACHLHHFPLAQGLSGYFVTCYKTHFLIFWCDDAVILTNETEPEIEFATHHKGF